MIGPITTAMAEERLREYLQDVRTCSVVIVDQRTDGIYEKEGDPDGKEDGKAAEGRR